MCYNITIMEKLPQSQDYGKYVANITGWPIEKLQTLHTPRTTITSHSYSYQCYLEFLDSNQYFKDIALPD